MPIAETNAVLWTRRRTYPSQLSDLHVKQRARLFRDPMIINGATRVPGMRYFDTRLAPRNFGASKFGRGLNLTPLNVCGQICQCVCLRY